MKQRLNYFAAAPQGLAGMMAMEEYFETCAIEKPLIELVKLRASQINGCAYCIDMHWKDARAGGETEQRLYGLNAWRESPQYYTPRELAALEWAESLTKVTEGHVPQGVFDNVRPHFNDRELADLSLVIGIINAWNRIAIAFRSPAGTYQPKKIV